MTTYTVHAVRDGRFWLIAIPGLGGATQALHVAEISEMARDYINTVTDEPVESIDLDLDIAMPPVAAARMLEAAEATELAEELKAIALAQRVRAAHELRDAGLTVRDIGALIDRSHQRVHQLLAMDADDPDALDARLRAAVHKRELLAAG